MSDDPFDSADDTPPVPDTQPDPDDTDVFGFVREPAEPPDDEQTDEPRRRGRRGSHTPVRERPRAALPAIVLGALALVAGGVIWWAASRGDGKPDLPPLPPGAVAVDAWAPYWTLSESAPVAEERLADIREISPFWFGARGAKQIVVDEHASESRTSEFLEAIAKTPARLVPSIRDEMPAGGMARILANPTTRATHVAAIVAFAEELDADGIDLDYEQFAFADGRSTWEDTRPNWVEFVADLATALHADGRTLTISIPPVYDAERSSSSGYWVYDHGAIAEHVDAIRIMGYDYSVSEPGPIAPIDWVRNVVAGVSEAVPEEYHRKLVLGVPVYGYNWVLSTVGECPADAEGQTTVSLRSVDDLASRRGGTPVYDAGWDEWTFDYELTVGTAPDDCVQSREVRWVGVEGVAARAELARRAGWGGVGLWALGYENPDAWSRLVATAHEPMSATTEP